MEKVFFDDVDWQPVILLKIARLPFSGVGSVSVKRAYLALHENHLLYADWTLEAAERCTALVCATGWTFETPLQFPLRLQGNGAHFIPAGTWILPYTDRLFTLYSNADAALAQLITRIDHRPTDPAVIATLIRLTSLI